MKYWRDITLPIPEWFKTWVIDVSKPFPEVEQRMSLVIDLARMSIKMEEDHSARLFLIKIPVSLSRRESIGLFRENPHCCMPK